MPAWRNAFNREVADFQTQSMQITLAEPYVSFIDRQVKSGRFASAEEAVAEALTLLEERECDDLSDWNIESLRREVQLGIDSLDRGEGVVVTRSSINEFVDGLRLKRDGTHALAE